MQCKLDICIAPPWEFSVWDVLFMWNGIEKSLIVFLLTIVVSRKEKGIRPTGKKRKAGEEELSTSDPDVASSSSFGKVCVSP